MWNVLFTVAALTAILGTFILAQPSDFVISRQATIKAPAQIIFDQVNDFHKWEAWSPWAKMDPAAQNTFEGAPSGKGAGFRWSGNDKVGAGNMTITDVRVPELILIRLEFLKPFAAVNTTEFTFREVNGQTLVTWTMSGTQGFIGKAMGLVMNCDKMVGEQFEKGLASLKAVAEGGK